MKVALCFYGQPRFVDRKEVQDSYHENIISKYDTDVLCHAWHDKEEQYEFSSWSGLTHHNVPKNALEIITSAYKPTLLIHDTPITFKFDPEVLEFIDENFGRNQNWNERNYSNLISQLWSIQRISDYLYLRMVRGANYDWVILARYDTTLHHFPDLNTLDNSKLYIPDNHRGFPDMIKIFGPKYLAWSRNVFFDIKEVYKGIVEPTPEAFKHQSFLKRFSQDDISYNPIRAYAMR